MINLKRHLRDAPIVIGLGVIFGLTGVYGQHDHHGERQPKPVVRKAVEKGAGKKVQGKKSAPSVKMPQTLRKSAARTKAKPTPPVREKPRQGGGTGRRPAKSGTKTHGDHQPPAVNLPDAPHNSSEPKVMPATGHKPETGAHHHHHPAENHSDMPREPAMPVTSREQPAADFIETPERSPIRRREPEAFETTETITLGELEQMALENNPTLRQAESRIRVAEAKRQQAGMLPNPVVGYMGEDLSVRNFSRGGRHMFFVEQRIPLGGKLAKGRRVFAREISRAEAEREGRRIRVLNSIRLLYFEALGRQRVLEIKKALAELADESVEISAELYNVGLEDRPDQLGSEIEQQRADAGYDEALNQYEAVWQKIGAVVGRPDLRPARLEGSLTDLLDEIDAEELLAELLRQSPEIKAAEIQVERARAALVRARAETAPDLFLRGGIGYNREPLDDGSVLRRVGTEGFIEVGATLPIFNRNQGGIKSAKAELVIAEDEVRRLKLSLRGRFAGVLSQYRTAVSLAEKYRTQILPRAKTAYEMYSANFRSMTAAYTSVLSTRAAYLQAQAEYAQNVSAAQKALVLLKGFLLTGGLKAGEGEESSDDGLSPVNGEEQE